MPKLMFHYITPMAHGLITGLARLLDLGATLPKREESRPPSIEDGEALYSDWCSVGDDLYDAIVRLRDEHGAEDIYSTYATHRFQPYRRRQGTGEPPHVYFFDRVNREVLRLERRPSKKAPR